MFLSLNDEKDLLSRGLSFCPKPSQIDHFQLEEDIRQYFRRTRLKICFYDMEGEDDHPIRFKNKSKWTPHCNRDPALETYIKAVREDIHHSLDRGPRNRSRDNLTSHERSALWSLRSRSDIVIKPADKGLLQWWCRDRITRRKWWATLIIRTSIKGWMKIPRNVLPKR